MSGNGGDNAHDSAFGGGKNPGMGNTGSDNDSGNNSGSSGSGANVGLGGSMDIDMGNGVIMHVDGTHALSPGEDSGIPWGGGSGHGNNGGDSGSGTNNSGSSAGSAGNATGGGTPTTWDRTADYYGSSNVVSRDALKNMYEKAVSTGVIPEEARGELRENVQAMLDEDKRLADIKAEEEAERQRQAAEAEKQRQAYDAALKADAAAMTQAEDGVKVAEDASVAAETALQDARNRLAGISALPVDQRTVNYYGYSNVVSRDALKNMYEKAVSTGSIPGAARGQLRENVQSMLDEDKRLADSRAAAEADVQRLSAELANAQQAVVTAKNHLADVIAQAQEKERLEAEEKQAESDALEKTSGILVDAGEKISEQLGDKYNSLAKAISDEIKNFQGKNIRSFDDAMTSLNKVLSNPDLKINKADREALVNAWNQIDAQDMANKLGNLSKAFKVADVVMKVESVREKSIVGYNTGDWGPLMLEVESWVLSGIASSVALGVFSTIVGFALLSLNVPAVIVGIAGVLAAAFVGSLIDDKFADFINNEIIKAAH